MRPIEVTKEQIIEAGNQIISAGRSVTGFALRKIIKAKNINITDDEIKKSNTRNIGKRVIEAIKAT